MSHSVTLVVLGTEKHMRETPILSLRDTDIASIQLVCVKTQ